MGQGLDKKQLQCCSLAYDQEGPQWVGKLYDLEKFEDIGGRLIYVRRLLADHAYSVRQSDRKVSLEVCSELPELQITCC